MITVKVPRISAKDIADEFGQRTFDLLVELGDQMKKSFATPKHGRVYKRSYKTRKRSGSQFRRKELIHRASAPGEPPANDSGTLARSITVRYVNAFNQTLTISAPYAEALDEGTDRIAARPFVEPAIIKVLGSLKGVGIKSFQ